MTPSPRALAEKEAARKLATKKADALHDLRDALGAEGAAAVRRYVEAMQGAILREARDIAQLEIISKDMPSSGSSGGPPVRTLKSARAPTKPVKIKKPGKVVYLDRRGGR